MEAKQSATKSGQNTREAPVMPPTEKNASKGPETTLKAQPPIAPKSPDGRFIIPVEDLDSDAVCGEELDLDAEIGLKARKPGKTEWVRLVPGAIADMQLLVIKDSPDDMDEKMCYVDPKLRARIADDIRGIRFVLCYSLAKNRHFLWPVKVSNTDWFRSLDLLLRKPPEFLATRRFRIRADKEHDRYRIRTGDCFAWMRRTKRPAVA